MDRSLYSLEKGYSEYFENIPPKYIDENLGLSGIFSKAMEIAVNPLMKSHDNAD